MCTSSAPNKPDNAAGVSGQILLTPKNKVTGMATATPE